MSSRTTTPSAIATRPFGRSGDAVSILALGGYHLGKVRTVTESVRLVHEAIDAGVTFLDNAGPSRRRWCASTMRCATP